MKQRLPHLAFAAAAALLTCAAAMMMFSVFMFYDDEGYVLVTLRNFAEHGNLYREVYSQYGPFLYVFYYALHELGLPLTHTAGRLVTLLAWSGTAVACALLVGRATRSLVAQLAVLAGVFIYLWIMPNEPTHPGGLIAVATALLAWLGYRWIDLENPRALARLFGAGIAVLALTKINIGAFAACAALAWFALHHTSPAIRRLAPGLLAVGIAVVPFALMRALLGTAWVQTYALLIAASGLGAVGAVALGASPRLGWRDLGAGAVAALCVGAVVLAVIFSRGTSPADLLEGVLLGPLRHPASFSLQFPWPSGTRAIALVSPALLAAAWWLRRRAWAPLDGVIAGLRLLLAAGLAFNLARFPAASPDHPVLIYAAPSLWLFLWPLAGERPALVAARAWVGLLFLGQTLHAFPVPGSQISWGTLLALPLAALGAWPAAAWFTTRGSPSPDRLRPLRVALTLGVLAFATHTGWQMIKVGNRYSDGARLDLPGAERLSLPESAVGLFQTLVLNAVVHSDMVFSEPGMFSFNLWTGRPTPTLANVTHWFSLLDAPRQQAIIRELEAHPRASVIVQRVHMQFLQRRGLTPAGPLHDYLAAHFESAFTLDDFEFHVRKGRTIAPLLLAELFERTPSAAAGTAAPGDTLLKFNVLLPPGAAVASIDVVSTARPDLPVLTLRGDFAQAELTPINLRGEATRPSAVSAWPLRPAGPTTVAVYFDRQSHRLPLPATLLVLRDAAGAPLALARLRP
jgi:hypothetical protein